MAYSQGVNFLFCELCGTFLKVFESNRVMCPWCKKIPDRKGLEGREISYTITAKEIRKKLGILLIDHDEEKVELPKIKRMCEECGNDEATYFTRQVRSADEGQTTFYTCTRCQHQFMDN